MNFPIMMLKQLVTAKIVRDQSFAMKQLVKNKQFVQKAKRQLENMAKVQQQFIRRSFTMVFMRTLKSKRIKRYQHLKHLESFEYLFDCIRIRVLFECFTQLSIKTLQKNIDQLEKKRMGQRDHSRRHSMKRHQSQN